MYGQMQTYMYNAQGIPEQPLKPQTRLLYRGIMNAQALLVSALPCMTSPSMVNRYCKLWIASRKLSE